MIKNASKKVPKFSAFDELVAFFDTHDMGDYWDSLPEAEFDVDIESEKLSMDPGFIALIEHSRVRQQVEGGIPSAKMRRRLGLLQATSPSYENPD
jgi:hypothetical protein